MATLVIKNFPEDLFARLKRLAASNRRSIDREVISCVEQVVGHTNRVENIQDVLARAKRLRKKTARHPITDSEFSEAKVSERL